MSVISYDPNEPPSPSYEWYEQCRHFGGSPVQVCCYEPTGEFGVAVFIMAHFVPRIGEIVVLDDGTKCHVDNVCHVTATIPDDEGCVESTCLVPNIFATKRSD